MNKNKPLMIFAILAFSFLIMGVGITSPALASIGKAFPNIDFSVIMLIATLPVLVTVPFSLLAGKLAGNRITFRSLVIIGIILFIIGGTAPYFISSFTGVLIMRGVLGIGLGLLYPIPAALIMNLFEGTARENLMGFNGVIQNIGGIVLQLLGGVLCAVNWRNTFLAYLLAIIPLIIVIFLLPEPPNIKKAKNEKIKIPTAVYVWSIIILGYTILLYPMLTGMSSLVINNNLGTAAAAAVVLTMFTVGGMISGAVFGKVYRIATRFTFAIGLIIHAIGYIFLICGNSLMAFTIGSTIVGIGYILGFTAILMSVGTLVTPSATTFAMSLVMAFMSIGGFISGFFFSYIERIFNITSMRFPFTLGAICLGIYSIIHILLNLKSTNTHNPSVPEGPQSV
jgi:MFS family permease